ncbi:isopenicillin n-CoA epimerase [Saitoella complicata NRRL Y-17804]|nr:isopenicillin n-CoA epimerase [Saitoella complicata NRRL Y-17804]ODQ53279.1 isopenicillin n-CoA epimerase [Saitoella complicata NRRL Y-17804]
MTLPIRVLELAGLAPVPYAGLLLSQFGADVVRIDRADVEENPDFLCAGKRSLRLDLKTREGREVFLNLARRADVVIEPFRPGVMEKLGLSPDELIKINPRLIYARLTGFPRNGKYSKMAGHDVNYVAISGVLSFLGYPDRPPQPPTNLLADFAGGSLTVVIGILLALLNRNRTGHGSVVNANMVDAVSHLGTFARLSKRYGSAYFSPVNERGEGLLDGGAPWYGTYETKDGKYMAVGALEPQFYAVLVRLLGLEDVPSREERVNWAAIRTAFERKFKEKTRKEWEDVFDASDACVTPVKELDLGEKVDTVPLVEIKSDHEAQSVWTPPSTADEGGALKPGTGEDEVLQDWLGWRIGREAQSVPGKGLQRTVVREACRCGGRCQCGTNARKRRTTKL